MMIITIFASILLSIFSTAVMSYIAMATPIGPWIAPTLALMIMPIFSLLFRNGGYTSHVGLATFAGSIGGILATGMGFSFPTLYFLNPELFNSWMAQPVHFVALLAVLSLAAGGFGLLIANLLEHKFLEEEKLAFPVGQLVYKMIAVHNQAKKAFDLALGFIGTAVFCIVQDGILGFRGFVPKALTLLPKFNIGALHVPLIRLDIWPMVWAIGFVTGHVIAVPLAVGALSKIFIIDPLNQIFFTSITNIEFILAFCSGMVISGTLLSFISAPKMLYKTIKKIVSNGRNNFKFNNTTFGLARLHVFELGVLLIFLCAFLSYLEFSLIAQVYLLLFTAMCTYEIASQAGKMGLARLGMFATFVMVPAMLLFNLTMFQIVMIATFVEICGGVAADVLFGRKMAKLAGIAQLQMERYQWLGLLISSLSVGIVFWLLINQFHLGSPELFALKAQNRQLLINAHNFNLYVLAIGFVFGFFLKETKVNPSLVLGGILMPISISLGLIVGGMLTMLTKDKEEWYPLWSGVFAANSVWMLVKAIL